MSEHASYDTYIYIPPLPRTNLVSKNAGLETNPNLDTLRAIIQKVAKSRGGRVSNRYEDNAGAGHRVWTAIETPDFPRGVGINMSGDGTVLFQYDTLCGNESTAKEICAEVKQGYVVVKLLRALAKLGFRVETREQVSSSDGKSIIISARRYGGQNILATVDSSGSIDADFAGYRGQECIKDEAILNKNLKMNGVNMVTKIHRSKSGTRGAASWERGYGSKVR